MKMGRIKRPLAGYAMASVFTLLAALLGRALPSVLAQTPFLAFYPALVISAVLGGFGPGLVATIGGALFYFLWFDPTPDQFSVVDLVRIAIFCAGGTGVSILALMQRRRDEALRESEEKLSRIAQIPEENPNPVLRVSSDGKLLYANAMATKILAGLGWHADQVAPEQFQSLAQRACKSGGYIEQEIEIAEGQIFSFAVSAIAEEGYVNLYGRDVTERRKVEEALWRSEQRMRATFDNAGVGIVEAEGDEDHFIAANQQACVILGRSREQLLSMKVHELTWPEDRPLSDRLNRELHAGLHERVSYEKRYIRGDGSPVWVHMTVSAVRDADGRWIRAIATMEDITERKKTEEALKESELFHRKTLESIPGMVFTTRPDGYCDYQSQQWVDYTGVPMSEHLGNGWNTLLHPDDRPRAYAAWRAAVEERAPYDLEYRVRRHDGIYEWFKVIGRPIRDGAGQIVRWFGVALNIEDLKHAEADLYRLNRELDQRAADLTVAKTAAEQANRTKDHFLAVLSHELRTPLTPVVMGVSLLQDRQDFDPKVRETLEMIRSNVDMEARLIDDLLDVTRIVRGKVELSRNPVELCTVIQRAVEVCKPDIDARRLHFGVDLGPSAPYWVEADVSRLQQVFWNLLKNAIKFTPHGGCVGIRCRPSDEHVLVEVNDSGIGIESEALPRIFDAFEQAERSITRQFGGLGLGLAISKALVEMHGGEIEAQSEGRNKGATFRIRLPLSAHVRQPGVPISAVSPRLAVPLRILLVEDHGVTARMIHMVLSDRGHTVEIAGDVATALDVAARGTFDLLLSDLGLPDGSGHDLIRELRARGYKFPGIALTGYGQEDDIQRSYQAGFAAHLIKPASRESVIAAVESVIASDGRPALDSSMDSYTDLPVFDADVALERCFGKREMLEEMVEIFPKESTELLSQMHMALSNGSISEIGRAAHRLKGTVVFLGAQPASNAALEVEQASKSGDLAAAEKAIVDLERQVELLRKVLASHTTKPGSF